ncbi:MAG: hypothetical protein ACLSUG_10500, partial [Alistipes shahii]
SETNYWLSINYQTKKVCRKVQALFLHPAPCAPQAQVYPFFGETARRHPRCRVRAAADVGHR